MAKSESAEAAVVALAQAATSAEGAEAPLAEMPAQAEAPAKATKRPATKSAKAKAKAAKPVKPALPKPQRPKVSVIVPVYNLEQYLPACLESILRQTYPRLEVIIVDDGSTDGSAQVIKKYQQLAQKYRGLLSSNMGAAKRAATAAGRFFGKQNHLPTIKTLYQKNSGLSSARNAGVQEASGVYLTFVDGDDVLRPDFVERLMGAADGCGTKVAVSPLREVPEQGSWQAELAELQQAVIQKGPKSTPYVPGQPMPGASLITTEDCLERMLLETDGLTVAACGKLYAKELFETVEFPEGALHEDLDTTYRLIMQGEEVAYVPEPGYYYVQRPGSIVHRRGRAFDQRRLDIIKFTDQMCDAIDLAYPELERATSLRRMHGRFSVLQMMVRCHLTKSQRATRRRIMKYQRAHRDDVLRNPLATQRDRLAMQSLLVGWPAFALAWRVYRHRRQQAQKV